MACAILEAETVAVAGTSSWPGLRALHLAHISTAGR